METEAPEITLAKHEERLKSLEEWKSTLSEDVSDLRTLIGNFKTETSDKLDSVKDAVIARTDKAMTVAERTNQPWVTWALTFCGLIIGALTTLVAAHI